MKDPHALFNKETQNRNTQDKRGKNITQDETNRTPAKTKNKTILPQTKTQYLVYIQVGLRSYHPQLRAIR